MDFRRTASFLFGLCAVGALVAPAGAQPLAAVAQPLAWSKSDAILGAPSALQAMLEQQQAPARAVAPASYSIPKLVPAVLHADEGIGSGRPDVFGTVALKVGHTRLDARWHAVEHQKLNAAPAMFAASLRNSGEVEQLRRVNRFVNRRVRYVDDQRRFGRVDVWSGANETLRAGRGDCEDYAIAKFQLLRAAGFSDRDLYVTIVRDLVRRADHAVLVARAAGKMYVLDNGTDELLESAQVSDYRPILTFASYGEWTHGYRVEMPANIALADGQRSRSASLLALSTGFSK